MLLEVRLTRQCYLAQVAEAGSCVVTLGRLGATVAVRGMESTAHHGRPRGLELGVSSLVAI